MLEVTVQPAEEYLNIRIRWGYCEDLAESISRLLELAGVDEALDLRDATFDAGEALVCALENALRLPVVGRAVEHCLRLPSGLRELLLGEEILGRGQSLRNLGIRGGRRVERGRNIAFGGRGHFFCRGRAKYQEPDRGSQRHEADCRGSQHEGIRWRGRPDGDVVGDGPRRRCTLGRHLGPLGRPSSFFIDALPKLGCARKLRPKRDRFRQRLMGTLAIALLQ